MEWEQPDKIPSEKTPDWSFSNLGSSGIRINRFSADSVSYQKNVADLVERDCRINEISMSNPDRNWQNKAGNDEKNSSSLNEKIFSTLFLSKTDWIQ